MRNRPLFAYFGHHRCASEWINKLLFAICRILELTIVSVSNSSIFGGNIKKYVKEKHIDWLCYINADFNYIRGLDNLKGFHVIRDPRDIIVSAYFSHLYSHPEANWLANHRKRLKAVSKEEGILLEMKFIKGILQDLQSWNYSYPHILQIKMEDLIENPNEIFTKIFHFLELLDETLPPFRHKSKKIPLEQLLFEIYNNKFSKNAQGRKRGEENIKSHYRKGIVGDWVNHFNEEHIKYFKKNYNDLLIKLKYESGSDW